MTEERLPLSELLEKAGDGDFLRSVAEAVLQLLMETDVEGLIGAGRMSAVASGRPGATATGSWRPQVECLRQAQLPTISTRLRDRATLGWPSDLRAEPGRCCRPCARSPGAHHAVPSLPRL